MLLLLLLVLLLLLLLLLLLPLVLLPMLRGFSELAVCFATNVATVPFQPLHLLTFAASILEAVLPESFCPSAGSYCTILASRTT